MSEEKESFKTEPANIKTLSHKRILLLMGIVAVLFSIYGFIDVSWQFGFGVVLGGILSFVNYYWLKHSLRVVFEQAERDEQPAFAGTRYILRYFIFGLVLGIIYLTKTISVVAIILGLASFAFAIVIEGIIRIFTSFNK
jgi:uncharacterized membrane protein HdeD (DUF308 family)